MLLVFPCNGFRAFRYIKSFGSPRLSEFLRKACDLLALISLAGLILSLELWLRAMLPCRVFSLMILVNDFRFSFLKEAALEDLIVGFCVVVAELREVEGGGMLLREDNFLEFVWVE